MQRGFPVEVTRIEVKRKWIVPTRWLRRRINAKSFFLPRMLRMAYRIDADALPNARRDADAEYLHEPLPRHSQHLLRLAVARARTADKLCDISPTLVMAGLVSP
jgi:hypothetical protein